MDNGVASRCCILLVSCLAGFSLGLDFTRVQRHPDRDPPRICPAQAVCADLFVFNRLMDDDTERPEARALINCECPNVVCAWNWTETLKQTIFRETKVHMAVTCEPKGSLDVCSEGQVAKEERSVYEREIDDDFIYHKINCLCPNNEEPSEGFRHRATERIYGGDYIRGVTEYRCKPHLFK